MSDACWKMASADRICARAESARAAAASACRYRFAADEHDQIAGALHVVAARRPDGGSPREASLMVFTSKIDCDSETRASNTLNGPTIGGTPAGSGKPNDRQVDDLPGFADPAVDVRQQVRERGPSGALAPVFTSSSALSSPRLCWSAAVDGVDNRQRQRFRVGRTRGHAAEKR